MRTYKYDSEGLQMDQLLSYPVKLFNASNFMINSDQQMSKRVEFTPSVDNVMK
jgi:hypothetical protein